MWVVVQLLSHIRLFATLWTAVHQASLSFTISWSFFKLMCIESVVPSNYLILCQPLLLPSIFPSIRSFPMSRFLASGGQSIGASTSVFPMNIQGWFPSGLTLGFDLLAVQGTLKSLFQQHCFKASVASAFFMIQISHLYMTTGKTIALTLWIILSKVMSLLFNTLSRFVIVFTDSLAGYYRHAS